MNLRYTLNNDIEGEHITAYSPKGWEDMELVLKRHEKYDGIFKDYTVKVDFFCGAGKEYIDNIYDTQGIEGEVTILIEIDCDDSGDYDTIYEGIVMMRTYEKTSAAPEYTRVNLMQDGIIQSVLSRLETKVDLAGLETLDGTALTAFDFGPYVITLHSKMIKKISELSFSEDSITDVINLIPTPEGWVRHGVDADNVDILYHISEATRTLEHSFSQSIIPDLYSLNEVNLYTGDLSTLTRSITYPGDNAQIQSESMYIVANSLPESFTISGKFIAGVQVDFDWITGNAGEYSVAAAITPRLYLQVGDSITLLDTKPLISGSALIDSIGGPVTATVSPIPFTELSFEFNETITGVEDEDVIRVYLKFDSTRLAERPGTIGWSYNVDMFLYVFIKKEFSEEESSFIKITEDSLTAASTANAFAIFETGAQIARVITDQADSFRSSLFGRTNSQPYSYDSNGCGSFMAFVDGLQGRGFPLADNPVTMSMKDYFEGLHPIQNIGLGIMQENGNHYILIEQKEFFYRQETILTLNNIVNLNTKVDEKAFYNLVNIGYSEWEKEGTNGLDEYNSKRQFALKNKMIGNKLDLISPFVGSPYAFEETRRKQYTDFPTEDTNYDKSIFPICLNRTVDEAGIPTNLTEAEKDENFSNVENTLSPETSYNLRISPARNFRNFFNTISTSVSKSNATLKDIKFTYGEGNPKMISTLADSCDPGNQSEIDEGGNIELLIPNASDYYKPLITGEKDTFDAPFSKSQYDLLNVIDENGVPNIYKQIDYSTTTENHISGYIDEIRWLPVRGKASFKMARAYDRGVCSHVYVEADYVECGYVE
jgi:hypothetical protein